VPVRGSWRFALGALLLSGVASPIVMRHDVPERRYLELATRFPAAVKIRLANGSDGEGTLVGLRWVLTAAHVAGGVQPDDLVVAGGKSYLVERVFMHPEFRELAMAYLPYDIALVRLRLDVAGIEPASLTDQPEVVGSIVTFVGRGGFGTGVAGVRGEDGRLRAGTNRLEEVAGPFLKFRFDRPEDAGVTELEGISGPGDSGGAAFIDRDGKRYVIGVSSWQDTRPTNRVQGVYGVIENYVRVSNHYDWIVRTMREGN